MEACSFAVFLRGMEAFWRTVDEAVPANMAALVRGLAAGGCTLPEHLDHSDSAETIAEFPQEGVGKLLPASKAFLRRAIAKASAKVEGDIRPLPEVVQPPRPERLDELFGSEISAESVAAALGAKPAQVDVQDLLAKVQCSTLPPAMLLEVAVWQALAADTENANTKQQHQQTNNTARKGGVHLH